MDRCAGAARKGMRLERRQAGQRARRSGAVKTWSAPTTARGLAFQPKGYRVAVTHYNGVSLWFPKVEGAPQTLEWKGAHLDATFSPDGRFLVTSMQENALHGWRLTDSRNMRMTGYPAKTRSLSWSHDGAWLATSGADAARRLAVQGQGRADGQGAARMRRARNRGRPKSPFIRRRLSSPSATRTALSCYAGSRTRRKFQCETRATAPSAR